MTSAVELLRRLLSRRRYAYQKTFQGPLAEEVLADLARFCRANKSTFNENDRAHVLAEGRREVWLRINQHLRLSEPDLWRLVEEGEQ